MASKGDYEAEKQKLKEFLANFATTDEEGRKTFKYAEQLTAIAHRFAGLVWLLLTAADVGLDCEMLTK